MEFLQYSNNRGSICNINLLAYCLFINSLTSDRAVSIFRNDTQGTRLMNFIRKFCSFLSTTSITLSSSCHNKNSNTFIVYLSGNVCVLKSMCKLTCIKSQNIKCSYFIANCSQKTRSPCFI